MNKWRVLDVCPEQTRFCFVELKGCGAPVQIKVKHVEGSCFGQNTDLVLCLSTKNKEPLVGNCQKEAVNPSLVRFKAA
jgi:hypothetical protein